MPGGLTLGFAMHLVYLFMMNVVQKYTIKTLIKTTDDTLCNSNYGCLRAFGK